MRPPNNLCVARFGNEFWVVADTSGPTLTREVAERGLVERFPFAGPPNRGNPDARRALAAANRRLRRFLDDELFASENPEDDV